jgi:predicted ATPase
VREAVRQLLEQRPELRQLPEVQAFGGYLAVLLDPPTESQADPVPIDLLFRALAQLLRSADHPLCIFLNDLQWADEGTFEWLDFALSQLGNTPILWLGAYRREDKEALASLLERGERWTRDDRWAELELGPLGEKEIETLCRQLVPEQEWRDEIPRHVWEKSEGLPLFAVEEVRAYSEAPVSGKSSQDLIARRLKNSLNRTVSF